MECLKLGGNRLSWRKGDFGSNASYMSKNAANSYSGIYLGANFEHAVSASVVELIFIDGHARRKDRRCSWLPREGWGGRPHAKRLFCQYTDPERVKWAAALPDIPYNLHHPIEQGNQASEDLFNIIVAAGR